MEFLNTINKKAKKKWKTGGKTRIDKSERQLSWPRNTEFQRNVYLLNLHLSKYLLMSKHTNNEILSLIYQLKRYFKTMKPSLGKDSLKWAVSLTA